MMEKAPILYVVVPCYNEEEVLHETAKRLKQVLAQMTVKEKISEKSKILFVDDGSNDGTWEIITKLHKTDPVFCGLHLSCNTGHQNALFGGLMTAKSYADIMASIDADLQDDVMAMEKMVDAYAVGKDIVYGVRSTRTSDTFFKRFTAESFYKIMRFFGVDIVFNHADYRLMSKRAVEALSQFPEVNLFLRGMVRKLGFPSAVVPYERAPRFAGKSKYPFKKMLSFAMEGITSFTIRPLKLIAHLGILVTVVSIFMFLWSLIVKISGAATQGWTSIVASIWLIGGIQLLSLGVVGEYIGKIYNETKARPRYIVESFLHDEQTK